MSVDLTQFGYSKEIAEEMSARMLSKVIISSRFKGKRKYGPEIYAAIAALDNDLGADWYDYAFMDRVSDNVTITFYRIDSGYKTSARACFNLSCITSRNHKPIIFNCRVVKELDHWSVVSKVEDHGN